MSTKIEWCDETINPIQDKIKGESGRGYHCTKISPGCLNCYAETINNRFGNHLPFDGRKVEFELVTSELEKLAKWKKHQNVFIQSMGDLFHGGVCSVFQDTVYAVSILNRQHTILILTKRAVSLAHYWETPRALLGNRWYDAAKRYMSWKQSIGTNQCGTYPITGIPNVWHGLTVCNQQEWNEKGELFLSIPGKKFISHEPALERIDYGPRLKEISCLIAGGETSAKARPSHPDTFRSDRDQCEAAGIDFFFKGWGEYFPRELWEDNPDLVLPPDEFAKDFERVGKKAAGRTLDGRTHDDLPWVKAGEA